MGKEDVNEILAKSQRAFAARFRSENTNTNLTADSESLGSNEDDSNE